MVVENRKELFLIENKTIPWGDWGVILWEGLTPWDEDKQCISIERTGPFTPKAYFSNDNFIFTKETKELIENSSLKGIDFLYEIEKKKIINLDWTNWNIEKGITNYLDEIYEPEDIINNGVSDLKLKQDMPNYYLANIKSQIHLNINKLIDMQNPSEYITFVDNKLDDCDFFTGIERIGCFISIRAKDWLEKYCPNCFNYYLIKSN